MLPIQPQLDHFGVTTDEVGGVVVGDVFDVMNAKLKAHFGAAADKSIAEIAYGGWWSQPGSPLPSSTTFSFAEFEALYGVIIQKPREPSKGDVFDLLLDARDPRPGTIPPGAPIDQRWREEGEEDL